MKLTRRKLLEGGLGSGLVAGLAAAPAAASMAQWQWRHGHGTVLLYDPDLPQARLQAEGAQAWNRAALALEGDRIRFTQGVFAHRPALVRGISRQADAVLVQEVAEEAGYERTALEVQGDVLTWTLQPRIRTNR